MQENTAPLVHDQRPHWFVDAKWVISLLLIVVLTITVPTFVLYRLTESRPSTDIITYLVTYIFSPQGIDDADEIVGLRQQLLIDPEAKIEIFDGYPVRMTYDEIIEQSPREVRFAIFSPIAEDLYLLGAKEFAEEHITDASMRKTFLNYETYLTAFTLQGHLQIQRYLTILGIFLVVLFSMLMIFCHRYGRLVTPGVILTLIGLPALYVNQFPISESLIDQVLTQPLNQGYPFWIKILGIVLPFTNTFLVESYSVLLITGSGLILLAVFVKVFIGLWRWISNLFSKPEPTVTEKKKTTKVNKKSLDPNIQTQATKVTN